MHILYILFILPNVNSLFKNILSKKLHNINVHNVENDKIKNQDYKYNLNWYVIGEKTKFKNNKAQKITIWNNDYVVWRNNTDYYAMDNYCSHKGASLAIGKISNNNIICPYHGYEFNSNGTLCKVPGLNFCNTPIHNQNSYNIIEKNGLVYLNIINNIFYKPYEINIYEEPEAKDSNFKSILINTNFNAYGRIVSENSLDVMHIGFVHTFGNRINPSPITEKPPYLVNDYPYHYKTNYYYEAGENSIVKKIFNISYLIIENEFILPHTTIARVIFGNFTSTIVTNTLPINNTHSHLYVKTYRNFWINNKKFLGNIIENIANIITRNMMIETVNQDKVIIESIKPEYMDGKFNMKYDKLQNVYKTFYKKFIKNNSYIDRD
jgi:phenylpropionate dioxygenase-like ring-hydroxylating dioxygenase large terminal subunit